ncbi:hypothetical protein T12_3578 [Trichinella patagoniensis]|uniref:Uncharacterized protein n=1 Tax=Trichinella patagoniensis TaxID=990121 RepID=A0A0V0Z8T0_9BILA|nr:hypothetical protein T12_3578 [Trichinella patagoniensis]
MYIFTINANPLNESYSQISQRSHDCVLLKINLYKFVCNYDDILKEFLAIFLNTSRLFNLTSKWISPNIHKNTSLGRISLHLEFTSTAKC